MSFKVITKEGKLVVDPSYCHLSRDIHYFNLAKTKKCFHCEKLFKNGDLLTVYADGCLAHDDCSYKVQSGGATVKLGVIQETQ